MGNITLPLANSETAVPALDHNSIIAALLGDILPRNAAGEVENLAGTLGELSFRWLRSYAKEYLLGLNESNLKIYEDSNSNLVIQRDGSILTIAETFFSFQPSGSSYSFTIGDSGMLLPVDFLSSSKIIGRQCFRGSMPLFYQDIYLSAGRTAILKYFAYIVLDQTTGTVDFKVDGATQDSKYFASSQSRLSFFTKFVAPADGTYTFNVAIVNGYGYSTSWSIMEI